MTHPALPPGWAATLTFTEDLTVATVYVHPQRTGPLAPPWLTVWCRHCGRETGVGPGERPLGPVPAGGLTARVLRRLPLGELRALALGKLGELAHETAARGDDVGLGGLQWVDRLQQVRRPGRRGREDSDYLPLTVAYAELVARGERAPVRTLAERVNYTVSATRNLLHEARRRGLLTAPPRAQSGGRLTGKAKTLIADRREGHRDGPH